MVDARTDGTRPAWDSILRTDHWDLVHAYDSRHLGWLVLITLEHRPALADLTEDESVELGLLTRAISIALHDLTGCVKTYAAQFAENPSHPHVHVHLVARPDDWPAEHRGPRAFALLGASDDDVVSETARLELAEGLRRHDALASWH